MPEAGDDRSGIASRFSHTRLMRIATIIPTRPIAAHDTCRVKMWYGLLPLAASTPADADSTITSPSITNIATTTPIT